MDGDPGIRIGLLALLQGAKFKTELLASAEDFLAASGAISEGCIILDLRMPGMSGIDLQEELMRRQILLSIIFLSGHGDLNSGITAMRLGALDFLTKPIDGNKLIDRVSSAIELSSLKSQKKAERISFEQRFAKLTNREREILSMLIKDKSNRTIAEKLDISARTVEGHRSRIYLKLSCESLLVLLHQAAHVGVSLEELLLTQTATAH